MIPSDEQLEPVQSAIVIAERLHRLGAANAELTARAQRLMRQMATVAALKPADAARSPYFCSGCPHNTGTRFPEGSIAAGGIGCHPMAMYSGPAMMPKIQMGGVGAPWYSLASLCEMNPILKNMGEGHHQTNERTT